jgi:hypothetical protein
MLSWWLVLFYLLMGVISLFRTSPEFVQSSPTEKHIQQFLPTRAYLSNRLPSFVRLKRVAPR